MAGIFFSEDYVREENVSMHVPLSKYEHISTSHLKIAANIVHIGKCLIWIRHIFFSKKKKKKRIRHILALKLKKVKNCNKWGKMCSTFVTIFGAKTWNMCESILNYCGFLFFCLCVCVAEDSIFTTEFFEKVFTT